jgi:acyl carrier protein
MVLDIACKTALDEGARIDRDTALLASGNLFDSFGLLELVLRLEDAFELSIPDEDLDGDTFHSPRTIVTYLCKRIERMQ